MKRIDPYRILIEREGAMKVPALVYAGEATRVEPDALEQLRNAATLDERSVVLATPDIHSGFGVPIGCVFASPGMISPCAVGYDINCGMRLMATPFQAGEIDAGTLARSISRDVPLGEGKRNVSAPTALFDVILERGMAAVPDVVQHHPRLSRVFDPDEFACDVERIEDRGAMPGDPSAVSELAKSRGRDQLGSLGGGNHFIEIQTVDTVYEPAVAAAFGVRTAQIVVMIHSGSRGLGHQVGGEYMKHARQWDETHGIALPDRELAYFAAGSPEGARYYGAMCAAANFAFVNRYLMALFVRGNIRAAYGADVALPSVYDVPHNIAKRETHHGRELIVHRKGATRAYPPALMQGTPFAGTGQPVLIPGSMGTASYLLAGVPSGRESLFSVNHGAGRTMSRTAASGRTRHGKAVREAAISDEEFRRSMEGICLVCEDRASIKEEAPGAYKDIDDIIAVVTGAGLAKPVARMKPLAVLKG